MPALSGGDRCATRSDLVMPSPTVCVKLYSPAPWDLGRAAHDSEPEDRKGREVEEKVAWGLDSREHLESVRGPPF